MKKLISSIALLGIIAVLAPQVSLGANSNNVNVDSCRNVEDGIMVRRFGNANEYVLKNGVRDAGHGLREYRLSCVTSTQYKVKWVEVSETPNIGEFSAYNQNGVFARNDASYQDTKTYIRPAVVNVPNSVNAFDFSLQTNQTNSANQYAYIWNTSEAQDLNFGPQRVKALLQNATFTTTNQMQHFTVTDYYRGKYVLFVAMVKNNDGVSAIPNMGGEVDDVAALYFYIKPIETSVAPVPTDLKHTIPSCVDTKVFDGTYIVCEGMTLYHSPSKVSMTQHFYSKGSEVTLDLTGADRNQVVLKLGESAKTFATANGQYQMKVSYDNYNIYGGAILTVKSTKVNDVTAPEVSIAAIPRKLKETGWQYEIDVRVQDSQTPLKKVAVYLSEDEPFGIDFLYWNNAMPNFAKSFGEEFKTRTLTFGKQYTVRVEAEDVQGNATVQTLRFTVPLQ
ncbi:MAG: hypothetical protein WCW16_01495 [Candidatus Magasanikbacteria bacterium]